MVPARLLLLIAVELTHLFVQGSRKIVENGLNSCRLTVPVIVRL